MNTVETADEIFENEGMSLVTQSNVVRNTSTANLDSRLLVTTSDLAKHKARNMKLGDAAFNVDEYVVKLVSFMGGRPINTAREYRDRDREDNMDWTSLGKVAMGIGRRPPTIGFMLGPLSVEKKERKITKRPQEKKDDGDVVRPQQVFPLTMELIVVERRRCSSSGECYFSYGSSSR
jgi:non-structural maintenance of chromosomes element 4